MKIICVGRNYTEHAKELNNDVPTEPVLFMKPKSALLYPDKPLFYPEFTDDLHYECELVVRIGKNGRHITERQAKYFVDAITLGIDFTARDVQKKLKDKGLPWELAKAFDGSAAVGTFQPTTPATNLQNLHFELKKNEEIVQKGHTADMIFTVSKVIAFASNYFTLNIGDLIFTGTPAGVGPVLVYDTLQGFLEDKKVLEVTVR